MLDRIKGTVSSLKRQATWSQSKPALCYHSVGADLLFAKNLHSITPIHFEGHIEQLQKWGYSFLPAEEYLVERSRSKSKKITSITFDDGYKDILLCAIPILEAKSIPFTIFLSTRLLTGRIFWRDMVRVIIENNWQSSFHNFLEGHNEELCKVIKWNNFYRSTKGNNVHSLELELQLEEFLSAKQYDLERKGTYLTSKDIEALPRKLVRIGNHTHNHYRLATLTEEEQALEIRGCHNHLSGLQCELSRVFSIPFGENGSFNQNTIDLLTDLGFIGFMMTNQSQFGLKMPIVDINPRNLLYCNRVLPGNHAKII